MDMVWKWGSVVVAGMLELWAAIPLGFALQLSPFVTGVLSALGAIVSAAVFIFVGGSLRNWVVKRMKNKGKRHGRMARIWDKYGVIGLGLASPLLTGAPLGAAIGISLGAPTGKLMWWMTVGIIVWSAILTAAVSYGLLQFVPTM